MSDPKEPKSDIDPAELEEPDVLPPENILRESDESTSTRDESNSN